jgi:hypothetical protein
MLIRVTDATTNAIKGYIHVILCVNASVMQNVTTAEKP